VRDGDVNQAGSVTSTVPRVVDIVVIGAGPAGLSAALAASSRYREAGRAARVLMIDDNPGCGGQVWRHGPGFAPDAALHELHELLEELGRRAVIMLQSTRVVALPAPGLLLAEEGSGVAHLVRYGRLILATGARERLLPFAGWTLPGVTGAGGLQALIKSGVPVRGERVVIAGTGPLLFAAAATARKAGAQIVAIVEGAPARSVARFLVGLAARPSKLAQAIRLRLALRRTPYLTGSMVLAAHGTERVDAVTILTPHGERTLACERVACGYGLLPELTLARALGCATGPGQYGGTTAIRVDELQRSSVREIFAAGECTGIGGMELARAQGTVAGYAALGEIRGARRAAASRDRWRGFARSVERAFALTAMMRVPPAAQTLLCRCEDVSLGEVARCRDWRDAKLHTRCGMGPCQGSVCASAAAYYFGWDEPGEDSANARRTPLSPTLVASLMMLDEAASQP
jgi:NADPH-dependent 2,4-dienoyl-CoA reductase/sulfur reductase-like enzyme